MLIKLEVKWCASVEEVFDLEGMSTRDGDVGLLPRLSELHLIALPMLRCLWNMNPKRILEFKNLKVLKVKNCSSLKYAFTWAVALCLDQLQEVELKNCRMMEGIIIKNEEANEEVESEITLLRSLASLVLECLPKLSSGKLECPTLKTVSIYDCPNVTISFTTEQRPQAQDNGRGQRSNNEMLMVLSNVEELSLDTKSTSMILDCELPLDFFSKVKVLKLRSLAQKSFFHLIGTLQRFSTLEKLVVGSSSFKELFMFEDHNGEQEDVMILPHVKTLELYGLHKLKTIWKEYSQSKSPLFDNLKVSSYGNLIDLTPSSASFRILTTLKVSGCNKLVSLLPLSVAKSMVQLETLIAEYCDMLKEIVGGEQDTTSSEIVFNKMRKLELVYLPSLQSFCSDTHTFKFPSLREVTVSRCPNLNIFCPGDLETQELDGVRSSRYDSKQDWEGDLNATVSQLHSKMTGYEDLWELKLSKFPVLQDNWHGQFPFNILYNKRTLKVDECASFSNAIPSNLLQYLNGLKVLVVENCGSVKEVLDLEGLNVNENDDLLMRWLRELHLIHLPELRVMWNKNPKGILSFKNLTLVKVEECGNLTHIFTMSVALGLKNLKHIKVKRCSLVEQIITMEDKEDEVLDRIIFPSLEFMSLKGLPSLLNFHSAKDVWKCPSLKKIQVVDCPQMNFLPSVLPREQDSSIIVELNEEKLDKDSSVSPLFGGKVAVQVLEELVVELNTIKQTWHETFQTEFLGGLKALELKCYPGELPTFSSDFHQKLPNLEIRIVVSDSFYKQVDNTSLPQLKVLVSCSKSFQNLTVVEVSNCHGLINLMSASAAKSLVQLKRMDIKDCDMIQEIVAPEEEEATQGHEIEFGQLTFLGLDGLPSLTSFSSGNFAFNFPSLEEVIIRECSEMKTFAKNALSQRLWRVQTGQNKYEWDWEGSLDNTVSTLFSKKNVEESS